MARIAYDGRDAAAFEATRHVPDHGLAARREAVTRHLDPRPGAPVLIRSAFATAGFTTGSFEPVPQTTAPSFGTSRPTSAAKPIRPYN